MKKIQFIWLFLMIIGFTPLFAQQKAKFSIASFEQDPFDLTAKNDAYKKIDGSGSLYAIIKVTSNNPDDNLKEYNFNFGNLRSIVEHHDDELWVYVQKNAKIVTISRAGYTTINKYDLKTTIEAGKTYTMSLTTSGPVVYTQMLQFVVKPANVGAVVMIKSSKANAAEELFGTVDATGAVAKSLEYGTYTYKVVANNYHTSEGRIILKDKTKNYIEEITLRPNFSEITLNVNSDADIYVNNEKKGTRTWTGILRTGNYQVECRQANHRNSSQYITITENENRTIDLTPPTPITGTLALTSRPLGANISIDGKSYGVTPQNINDLIIGNHTVTLSKANYKSETQTFEVRENQTTDVNITLNDIAKMTIKSRPSNSTLYIDGKKVGTTPYTAEMGSGDYDIRITNPQYHDFSKRVHLDSSNPEVSFKLDRQYQLPTSGYAQASLQAGTMMGVGGNIGGYISNINIEAYVIAGLGKENLYVNYTTGASSVEESLSGLMFGGKVGYGFIIGTRLRITPQVGLGSLSVKGNEVSTNVLCATAGMRFEYAIAPNFGVSLTPEGCFAVSKKDMFDSITAASSKIKGWATGANARIGVYVFF